MGPSQTQPNPWPSKPQLEALPSFSLPSPRCQVSLWGHSLLLWTEILDSMETECRAQIVPWPLTRHLAQGNSVYWSNRDKTVQ